MMSDQRSSVPRALFGGTLYTAVYTADSLWDTGPERWVAEVYWYDSRIAGRDSVRKVFPTPREALRFCFETLSKALEASESASEASESERKRRAQPPPC